MFCICGTSFAQIEGYWKGELKLGMQKLEMAFDIKTMDDVLSATLDVPAQGAFGVPVDKTVFQDGQLSMTMSSMSAAYLGTLKESVIEGTFTQRGMSFIR